MLICAKRSNNISMTSGLFALIWGDRLSLISSDWGTIHMNSTVSGARSRKRHMSKFVIVKRKIMCNFTCA
jgi:hypothetical protein